MLLLQEQGRISTLESLSEAGLWRFEHPGKTCKTVARQRGLCYPVIPEKKVRLGEGLWGKTQFKKSGWTNFW